MQLLDVKSSFGWEEQPLNLLMLHMLHNLECGSSLQFRDSNISQFHERVIDIVKAVPEQYQKVANPLFALQAATGSESTDMLALE